ncbi:hypothetical protein MM2B1231_4857 [Mycobacteroides abscessus subsp. bolletii 2B-1231]|uniref:Uncharacterized protein n=1 Tax=Mycobacteroides abscessus MAB_091912_2446 TaxID=1335414 RepID=A0A829MA93_9MYCO|nr:hypothetical protein MM2B0912R_0243 [Mycobacteroides abscessus subsp. bolletii 2B-0912-R]EIV71420.1 hypothetical protein MM2B1231_4857 [Mycobacteroides abscessus subsp. bolletii 2B-1231]ESV61202.1 hypothetical protein L833_3591 [Mycobacteroides abscessus MAB_091912_2446]
MSALEPTLPRSLLDTDRYGQPPLPRFNATIKRTRPETP